MDIKPIPFDDGSNLNVDDIIKRNSTINTIDDVKNFISDCINNLNLNFHPDDSFEDYVNLASDENTFTPKQALELNNINDKCFEVCDQFNEDYYELCFDIMNAHHGNIFGSDIKEETNEYFSFINPVSNTKPNRIISADRSNGEFNWINYQKKLSDHTVSVSDINKTPIENNPHTHSHNHTSESITSSDLILNRIYKMKSDFGDTIHVKYKGKNKFYEFESLTPKEIKSTINLKAITESSLNELGITESVSVNYYKVLDGSLKDKVIDYPAKGLNTEKIMKSNVSKITFPEDRIKYYVNMFKRQDIKYQNNKFFKDIFAKLTDKKELTIKQLEEIKFLIENGKTKYEANQLSLKY